MTFKFTWLTVACIAAIIANIVLIIKNRRKK